MSRLESIWQAAVESRDDSDALPHAYDQCLSAVLSAPTWSTDCTEGVRIPWRAAAAARMHPSLSAAFESPGLYLFGTQNLVPRYWGKAPGRPLWNRLKERYVCGSKSQCQLAADYENDLRMRPGIEGFPVEVVEWYKRRNSGTMPGVRLSNSTVRLEGAADFARHGIEGIWFTLLPMRTFEPEAIGEFEEEFIAQGNAWNVAHGYPLMVNKHHFGRRTKKT